MPFGEPTEPSPFGEVNITIAHLPTNHLAMLRVGVDSSMTSDAVADQILQAVVDAVAAAPNLRYDGASKTWTISRSFIPTPAEPVEP